MGRSDEAASAAADDDQIRVETCTGPCGLNQSNEAASTAADDDQIRVETCTDLCGLNRSEEAASKAADDDYIQVKYTYITATNFEQHYEFRNQACGEDVKIF